MRCYSNFVLSNVLLILYATFLSNFVLSNAGLTLYATTFSNFVLRNFLLTLCAVFSNFVLHILYYFVLKNNNICTHCLNSISCQYNNQLNTVNTLSLTKDVLCFKRYLPKTSSLCSDALKQRCGDLLSYKNRFHCDKLRPRWGSRLYSTSSSLNYCQMTH